MARPVEKLLLRFIASLTCAQLVSCQFANNFQEDFTFQCPGQQAITGVFSQFSLSDTDRRWRYTCGSSGGLINVSSSCRLEAAINTLSGSINSYLCPDNGYLSGFQSTHSSSASDRIWQPLCCERPHAALVDCVQQKLWQNELRRDLNLTLSSPDLFVVGVESFFDHIVNDRRWRYTYCDVEVSCGDPGIPVHGARLGEDFLYGDVVHFSCNHGYYLSEGNNTRVCQSTGLWSGAPPNCTECTAIPHCSDTRCSSAGDQVCIECESDHGVGLGRRGYENLGNECAPLCSWLGSYCYPGNCSGHTSTCECEEGFTGLDCLNMATSVDSFECFVEVSSNTSMARTSCTNTTSDAVFINFLPLSLDAQWTAIYQGLDTPPRMPAFVAAFSVGVADTFVTVEIFRASNPTAVAVRSRYECSTHNISGDRPLQATSCTSTPSLYDLQENVFHGDLFSVKVTAENGGYLDITNFDYGSVFREYYVGSPYTGTANYVVDLLPPVHCSLQTSIICLAEQPILNVHTSFLREDVDIQVVWGGYSDTPSEVQGYVLEVRVMMEMGGVLREHPLDVVSHLSFAHTGIQFYSNTTSLAMDGPYSLVLKTQDNAGNTRYARRLVLYDTNSSLEVDHTKPLLVVNAVQPSLLWMNTTGGPLAIYGRGHFYNTNLRDSNWLAPVGDYMYGEVEPEYDHPLTTGSYPRNGTKNAQGVVGLEYSVETSLDGPAGLSQPRSGWSPTTDIYINDVNVDVTRVDGMSVGVWFRATDFKGNVAVDVTVVHIDSSPPVAENIWIEYGSAVGLALHGSRQFTDLVVYFEASDPHSGLYRVDWLLGTTPGGLENGGGSLQLEQYNESTCLAPKCVCDPFGNCHVTSHRFSPTENELLSMETQHDTDYYITVTVTNNAMLSTTLYHRFTVDVTPPLRGVVFEGPQDRQDIDYQQDLTITFWWTGFVDRETDVIYYKYSVSSHCANASHFQSDEVVMTTDTSIHWLALHPGLFIVTVVAYNGAHRPSPPVCSDGITVDQQPPVITSVTLPSMYERSQGGHFVPFANFFNVSWNAVDNVGIWDYKVAIATVSSLLPSEADLVPLKSTGRVPFWTLYNTSLLSGSQVFVLVEAFDLAGNNITHILGPVVMDTTPPVIEGNLVFNQTSDHMIVTWVDVTITDSEEGAESLTYKYSLGTSPYGSQLIYYSTVKSEYPCVQPSCVAIDNSYLLSNNEYYVTLAVTNKVGLTSSLTGHFRYVGGELSPGVVMETISANDYDDVDVVMVTDTLFTKWTGLQHGFLPVVYRVAIGTAHGFSDVNDFIDVGGAMDYTFTNLTFEEGVEYFVTVVGETSISMEMAASDGFRYLGNLTTLMKEAKVFVENQVSLSVVMATWTFPSILLPHLSHYVVGVSLSDDSEVGVSSPDGTAVGAEGNAGKCNQTTLTNLQLKASLSYSLHVSFCHLSACLPPVRAAFSVDTPPDILSIKGFYSVSTLELRVSWSVSNLSVVREYQWTLGLDKSGGRLLLPWQHVTGSYNSAVLQDIAINSQVDTFVTIRAFSSKGLISSQSALVVYLLSGEVVARENSGIPHPTVLDVLLSSLGTTPNTSRWEEVEHVDSKIIDEDYTSSNSQMTAAWPLLRYSLYHWSVSKQPNYMSCDQAIACGQTHSNFVTVGDLNLENGHIYYLCLRAFPRDLIEPNVLPMVDAVLEVCTDGVTVLNVPPTPGVVHVHPTGGSGHLTTDCQSGKVLLTSISELNITWDGFEEDTVAYYEYSLGTTPGGIDAVSFTSVGVSYEAMVSGLRLLPGLPYYVTVKATDYVGQVATAESNPVIIDTTPPTVDRVWLVSDTTYSITSSPQVTIKWSVPIENESCVHEVWVSLGPRPGWTGSGEWVRVRDTSHTSFELVLEDFNTQDGDSLFANIKVSNVLGLAAVYSSDIGYLYDATPPVGEGVVYDGIEGDDDDYTTSDSTLSAHWLPYHDPHTHVHYQWAIGTCKHCRDVQEFTPVGSSLQSTADELPLCHGRRYYVSIRACNTAGLCAAHAYSNGITVDLTPPTVGVVFDGLSHMQVTHQVDRTHVYSSWDGFHDLESGLRHYLYSAGYFPGDTSLVPPTLLPSLQTSIVSPVNQTREEVFFTLTAVNNAGTNVSVHSGGVSLDDSHPSLSSVLVDTQWAGSAVGGSQYTNSVIRLIWNVTVSNDLTPTVYWTLFPPPHTSQPLPLNSAHSVSGVMSYVQLSDGDHYTAVITACTPHGLCTPPTISQAVLVDSSPPIDGYFVVETNSSVNITRHSPQVMTWKNVRGRGEVTLTWTGFDDPHSSLNSIVATVGSLYGADDLSGGPQWIGAGSEGVASVGLTASLNAETVVFISLWSVNKVGLPSAKVVGSFTAHRDLVSGNQTLVLLRSVDCIPHSCLGHCTCGPRGERCFVEPSTVETCRDGSSDRTGDVDVLLLFPQPPLWDSNSTYNIRRDKMEARWNYTVSNILWSEWSVALTNQIPAVWYPSDSSNTAIYTPIEGLVHGGVYHVLVRAWYSDFEYAVFTSKPVTVDLVGPSVVRGMRVWEGLSADIDYLSSDNLDLMWSGVFQPGVQGQALNFQIRVETIPEEHYGQAGLTEESYTLSISNAQTGRRYRSSVSAVNKLGLSAYSISDGFIYDNRTIIPGHLVAKVMDGVWLSLWWSGFHGYTTPIHHYEYALEESSTPPPGPNFTPLGISLSHLHRTPLGHGVDYTVYIRAVDDIGTTSLSAVSMVTGDETPPTGVYCSYDSNIVRNPSFEEGNSLSVCTADSGSLHWWDVGSSVTIVTIQTVVPAEGCSSALVKDSISQVLSTHVGMVYRVSLAVRSVLADNRWKPVYVNVEVDGQSVRVLAATGHWHYVLFDFTAKRTSTTLVIRSLGNHDYSFLVDDIAMATCSPGGFLANSSVTVSWPQVFASNKPYISQTNDVHFCWDIQDNETGLSSQEWAVGSSPGGTQHQLFQLATQSCGVAHVLNVSHGNRLYITLKVTNGAGLIRIIQSDAYILDLTPPIFSNGVMDGGGLEDLDHTSDAVFSVAWNGVDDGESGVRECYVGLGSTRGQDNLHPLIKVSMTSHTWNTTGLTSHTFYTVVICINGAGLAAMATSDGIRVIPPPWLSETKLDFDTPTRSTYYPAKQGYFPTDDITARWIAQPNVSPLTYQIRVGDGQWMDVRSVQQITLFNLVLMESVEHSFVVRGVAPDAEEGHVTVRQTFNISSEQPVLTGSRIDASWDVPSASLTVDWTGRVFSSSPLRYEVSLANVLGSAPTLLWLETDQTSMNLTHSRLSPFQDYILTITAVTQSGYPITLHHLVHSAA